MLILRDTSKIPQQYLGAVAAIGNFDGIHLGHREVIGRAVALARESGKVAIVLTFEPHPRRVFRPELPTLRIIPFVEKAHLLKECGVDAMRVIRFTREFAQTTAEQFVRNILLGQLQLSHVVTGDDFIFGHNREGNIDYLKKMAAEEGFGYTVCPQVSVGSDRCSSTRIRALLAEGRVEEASSLLGRPYSITGIVRDGDKRGRQLGFPTANIRPGRIFTPENGVYAIRARIGGRLVDGVANLGVRPTFGENRLQLEVHLFDWEEEIYGEHMETYFIGQIRNERKFDGIEALKKQITDDCGQARIMLESCKI
ncbi:MAG TPA: bifunctional riboflavin kinase/FAD synthetase [Rickettsiales bacterium]|nr:bifunctional riboflavin kinase/FAD synthetase [Rickettsiales bacterium]